MDKRIRKTRKAILDVFMQLLEEKGIGEITAQEIAEQADISRSTFYQHYTDVYHLLDQAEDEIFTELTGLLEGYPYEVVKADPLRLFTELFFYFRNNAKICLVLLNKNGSITTGQRISRMIQEKFRHEWEALLDCGDPATAHYLTQYIISGFVGILQEWIGTGMQEPEEEMALVARMFINQSVSQNYRRQYAALKEANTAMSAFKEKIGNDARNFAGGVLQDTSALVDEKSGEIQQKVEAGLRRASGSLAGRAEGLKDDRDPFVEAARKKKKLMKKKAELEEKFNEKSAKLTAEGKLEKLEEERRKYEYEQAKLDSQLVLLLETK